MTSTYVLDTGPLVAYLVKQEQNHAWAKQQFAAISSSLVTCEPVLSEACFLLRRINGGVNAVLELLDRGVLSIGFSLQSEIKAVSALLTRYASVPMSLADACLVRMVEQYPNSKIFTLDKDFLIYRKMRRQHIPTLIPE